MQIIFLVPQGDHQEFYSCTLSSVTCTLFSIVTDQYVSNV